MSLIAYGYGVRPVGSGNTIVAGRDVAVVDTSVSADVTTSTLSVSVNDGAAITVEVDQG